MKFLPANFLFFMQCFVTQWSWEFSKDNSECRRSRPWDGGGGGVIQTKKFFWPFRAQFGPKIRGGWAPHAPPLDLLLQLQQLLPITFMGNVKEKQIRIWILIITFNWLYLHFKTPSALNIRHLRRWPNIGPVQFKPSLMMWPLLLVRLSDCWMTC